MSRPIDSDQCVEIILSNLAYIEKELPDLDMDEALRQRLIAWCAELKQEVAQLQTKIRLLERNPGLLPGSEAVEMIHRQVESIDKLVISLQDLAASNPSSTILSVLFNESGANMLLAYQAISKNLAGCRPR